jgi:hypothetical protein
MNLLCIFFYMCSIKTEQTSLSKTLILRFFLFPQHTKLTPPAGRVSPRHGKPMETAPRQITSDLPRWTMNSAGVERNSEQVP